MKEFNLEQLVREQAARIALDKLCKISELTYKDLAEILNMPTSIVSALISGRRKMTDDFEGKAIRAMNIEQRVYSDIIRNVSSLIKENEPASSIEMWYAVFKEVYASRGKYQSVFSREDELGSWDK